MEIKENPENITVNGNYYPYDEAYLVFCLFEENDKPTYRYIFVNDPSTIHINGKSYAVKYPKGYGARGIHPSIIYAEPIGYEQNIIKTTLSEAVGPKNIHGRLWKIGKEYYISLWNPSSEVKNFISLIDDILNDVNIQSKNVYIQPYDQKSFGDKREDDLFIPYDVWKREPTKKSSLVNLSQRDLQKKLHLMSPAEKNKALKTMGAMPSKGKSIPDFIKKQLAGIDEIKIEYKDYFK